MKNWTIKKRILFGFASIILLVSALGITSYYLLREIKQESKVISTDTLPSAMAMAQINSVICDIHIKVLQALIAKNPDERKKLQEEVMAMRAQTLKIMEDYEKSIEQSEDRDMFNQVKAKRDAYVGLRTQYYELLNSQKLDEATAFEASQLRPAFASYREIVDKMMDWNVENAKKSCDKAVVTANKASVAASVFSIAVIILGITFATAIVVSTNRVLTRVATSLDDGSSQVSGAAGQVSTSSQSLAEGASQQAASLEETSSSLEEMASMTKRNSENALKANELAKQARSAADKGASDMQGMSAAMEAIKVSSDDIAKIIKTIDEIAFQTNILALNAAVEAARAGEAGMGFAVVADEVRNLAQRSAQAAKETAAKIEGAITKTGQGVEISTKVGQALNDIVTKVRQVDELVAEVSSASHEQTQGITQINTAVGQMDKVTQSNAANAEESAAAAEELNAQAESMKESVGELLRLVGGRRENKIVVPAATVPNGIPPASVKKAKVTLNGNGNGRHHGGKLEAAAVSHSRGSIPMDGDFKDF